MSRTLAFKFLRDGAVGPFSGVAWPPPADGAPGPWLRDVHACRPADLPLWIAEELWRVELREPVTATGAEVVGRAGRLIAPVTGWDAAAAMAFAADCAGEVRTAAARSPSPVLAGYAGDIETYALGPQASDDPARAAAVAGLVAARAACEGGGAPAQRRERERQARWLADRLALAAD
jgi:hypothetical protein